MKLAIETPPVGSPTHDLLASAVRATPDNNHWEQGITFLPEDFTATPASGEVVLEGAQSKSRANLPPDLIEYTPFLVEVAVSYPVGSYTDAERDEFARRVITRGQGAIIEQRATLGSVTGNMYLADTNCTTVAGTYNPPAACAAIQDAMAAVGGVGTLYVSASVAVALSEVTEERDGKLYMKNRGDLVIVGNFGATGPSDAAAAAGTSWIFGHLGFPHILLGEVTTYDGFDSTINYPESRVERVAAVVWNPGQWATLAVVEDGTP